MQVTAVNTVRESRGGEKEVGVLQKLAILDFTAVNNAKGILKNVDGLSAQEEALSQIGETDEIREFFWRFLKMRRCRRRKSKLLIQ